MGAQGCWNVAQRLCASRAALRQLVRKVIFRGAEVIHKLAPIL